MHRVSVYVCYKREKSQCAWLWYSGYCRRFLHDVSYLPLPVRTNINWGSNSSGKVFPPRSSPRTEFPLVEALHKFLKSIDNFVHTRPLAWIILNHVVNEWLHKVKTFISGSVGKDGMSLRKREDVE